MYGNQQAISDWKLIFVDDPLRSGWMFHLVNHAEYGIHLNVTPRIALFIECMSQSDSHSAVF